MKIPISEIYPAIQAEGQYRSPAVFVRVWGCNLRCGFNQRKDGLTQCDTPYAVFEGNHEKKSISKIVDDIISHKIPHVVFTGGEPMLYQAHLLEVLQQLPPNYFIEVETNGILAPSPNFVRVVDQFNISPKLKSSNQWSEIFDKKRVNPQSLKAFPYDKSLLKFVATTEEDIGEIGKIIKHAPNIPIALMPEGQTQQVVLDNLPKTLDLCLKHGYGFSNRDHILAYGDKRGV